MRVIDEMMIIEMRSNATKVIFDRAVNASTCSKKYSELFCFVGGGMFHDKVVCGV